MALPSRKFEADPRLAPLRLAGFQDQCIQPLCHPSARLQMLRACSAWPGSL
jgi:hypothetical protein